VKTGCQRVPADEINSPQASGFCHSATQVPFQAVLALNALPFKLYRR
jgi:hypothetical protein